MHSLHTNRLPQCLEMLTRYLLTSSSYHNLCTSLLATSQDSISILYKTNQSICERIRDKQKSLELDSQKIIAEVISYYLELIIDSRKCNVLFILRKQQQMILSIGSRRPLTISPQLSRDRCSPPIPDSAR